MDTFSTPCIFCGNDRPLAAETCPSCGRGWIDAHATTPEESAQNLPPDAPSAADEPASVPTVGPTQDADADAEITEPPAAAPPPPSAAPAHTDAGDTGWGADEAAVIAVSSTSDPDDLLDGSDPDDPLDGSDPDDLLDGSDPGDPHETLTAAPSDEEVPGDDRSADEAVAAAAGAAGAAAAAAAAEPPDDTRSAPPDVAAETTPPMEPEVADVLGAEGAPQQDRMLDDPDSIEIPAIVAADPDPSSLPVVDPRPDEPAEDEPAEDEPAEDEPAEDEPPMDETTMDQGPPVVPLAEGGETIAERAYGDLSSDELPTDDVPVAPPADMPVEDVSARAIDDIFDDAGIDTFSDAAVADVDPRTASDDMLDNEGAWTAFAAADPDAEAAPLPSAAGDEPPVVAPDAPTASFPGEHPDDSGFFAAPVEPPDGSGSGNKRSQRLIVGLIIVGIVAAWFVVLAWITRDDGTPSDVAAPGTTELPSTVVDTTPDTTPSSTSSTSTTTSSTTTTTLAPIEPIGDPIPIGDLGLGGFALGPLDFGSGDALGRLVATFGQPDEQGTADPTLGLCEGDAGFYAIWGPLTGVFLGTEDLSVFEGYRLVSGEESHPASGLATLSGLEVGDTVADLESTYATFLVSYDEIDGSTHFILQRTSDNVTLLWGPVSSAEPDGIVEGIYSPRPCDSGPSATG